MDKVGIVIPTLNAGECLVKLLDSLIVQNIGIAQILIIDSGSQDNTVRTAQNYQCKVISIKKASFNHGGTRKRALDYLEDIDIAVFLTQDVVLYDENSIRNLVCAFENAQVGAAYGRQLPHLDASPLAAQSRLFNYPLEGQVKAYEDKSKLGIKTTFLSDSFAAYRLDILEEIGSFPSHVIIAEDMYVAAKMLLRGYQIAYVAEACVYHSHDYSLWQEFKRYFDTGVFQAQEGWIQKEFGGAEGEGLRLVINQLKYLWNNKYAHYIPKAILANVVKLLGYRLGFYERYLPIKVKKVLSGQSYFFNS